VQITIVELTAAALNLVGLGLFKTYREGQGVWDPHQLHSIGCGVVWCDGIWKGNNMTGIDSSCAVEESKCRNEDDEAMTTDREAQGSTTDT
jgi:hypothetical protein